MLGSIYLGVSSWYPAPGAAYPAPAAAPR